MAIAVLMAAFLGGVAHATGSPTAHLRQGMALPPAPVVFAPARDARQAATPFEPTPEMKAWVLARVTTLGDDASRMRRLLTVLSNELPLVYDDTHTATAVEVFEDGHYNCLALSHLLVGLGRELGVDAYYARIETLQSYHRRGELVVVSTHVAAAWGSERQIQMVELDAATEREIRAAVRISDVQAMALHHTNRGAEALRRQAPQTALHWLDDALRLDPLLPEAWVNRGVALRRLGNPDGAEASYRQAIALDPDDLSAWRNLSGLLAQRGHPDAANELLALLDRRDNNNPFAYLALGDAQADPALARRFYRRGLQLDRGNASLRAALGGLALAEGDLDAAQRWLTRALRTAGTDPNENPRVAGLRAALASD